jgi:hypothetical protein
MMFYTYGVLLPVPGGQSWSSALGAVYPAANPAQISDVILTTTNRYVVSVAGPPAALLADYRFPQVRPADAGDPTSVTAYRNAVLDALDLWHAGWTQTVVIDGTTYTLRAGPDAQTLFDKMKLALAALADQTTAYQLFTTTGPVGPFAAAKLATALNAYGAALLDRELTAGTGFNARYFATGAAQSFADLDAITW